MRENLIWAFDIGSRSIGWAVMQADEDLKPTGEVVDAGVTIHSGGILDDSKGTTRHAVRGMVVRNRRRLKRKKSRRRSLREELTKFGFEFQEGWRPRNPWWARSVLATSPVEDAARVRHLVATALSHMSKHRGWRNPWLRSPLPNHTDEEKLEPVINAAEALSEMSGESVPATIGAVSWHLIDHRGPTKVRQSSKDGGAGQRNLNQWVPKVMQDQIAAELDVIWRVQSEAHPVLFTQESLNALCAAILWQEKPGVPLDRIGKCDFDDRFYRAPVSSPSFQRYRLLNVVTNLRIKRVSGEKESLDEKQRGLVLDLLNRGEQITWAEIEETLQLRDGHLVHADKDGTAGRPPINVVHERIENIKGAAKLRRWWYEADSLSREALVAMAISDRGFAEEQPEAAEDVAKEIENLDLLEQVEKFGRSLPSGRASYSRQVLNDLSDQMAEGAGLHAAIEQTYGHGASVARTKWDDPVPNNSVELSMREIRRLVAKLESEHGAPAVVGVEIVRDATRSHADRLDHSNRVKRQRESREETRQLLISNLGMENPSSSVIAKQEHITAQGGLCLYCGTKLLLPETDLDHIVPRRTGGATIFNNLSATCRPCNHSKGNRPFGRWCKDDGAAGEKRMEESLARLDNLTGPRWKPTPAKPFINPETGKWVYSELELARRDFRRRLKKTDWDREFDDAEIQSTAFVSRAVAERLKVRYPEARVNVFRGGYTAAMRNETKLPNHLGLGDKKDRSDRRHHAMDAIAVALLTNHKWASRVRRRNEAFQNTRLDLLSAQKLDEVRLKAPIEDLLGLIPTIEASGGGIIETMIPELPKRLSTTGRIHEDTVRPWSSKHVGDAWKPTDISSVRDQTIASALWRLSSSGGTLKEDSHRVLELGDGKVMQADEFVTCAIKFDETSGKATPVATWLPVRGGWAKTDEIHHARLIKAEWVERGKTKEAILMVPLSVADVYGSTSAFDLPLSSEMVGVRAHPKLSRLMAHDSKPSLTHVTSLTQGDVLLDGDMPWVITTFAEGNRAQGIPALHGGERSGISRGSFGAARIFSGEIQVVGDDTVGEEPGEVG